MVKECDHDYEWHDESFYHDFGTEVCGYWECIDCEHIDEDRPSPNLDVQDDHDWHS